MKLQVKVTFSVIALSFLSVVAFAAQESRKPAYKPGSTEQVRPQESNTVIIFKLAAPETTEESVKKARRAERTTALPPINRLKAETRKSPTVVG